MGRQEKNMNVLRQGNWNVWGAVEFSIKRSH